MLLASIALISVGLALYSYLAFPLVLMVWAAVAQILSDLGHLWRKGERRQDRRDTPTPPVAVVISAYNEEAHIEDRLRNLLEADYPAHLLSVYVGSDGSVDGTAALLQSVTDPRIHVRVFDVNRGKASVLNDLVALGEEPVIVFSDANAFFEPDAIRRLVRHFEDAEVGGVCGELLLRAAGGGDNQDSLYWRYEQVLKSLEARIGGLLGANGAIYAIRRSLWKPIEPDTICDDFCVAMNVSAAGSTLRYEPTAIAHEEAPPALADEFGRRLRIGIGNFQALVRHPEYLLRTTWATRFTYLSHKVLRWITPHLWLLSMAACLPLLDRAPMRWLFGFELAVLAVAAACYAATLRGSRLPGPARIVAFLFALNWAFLLASQRFARGRYNRRGWARTARGT